MLRAAAAASRGRRVDGELTLSVIRYNSGSNRNWNTGFYVAFMIFAIIYLCEPPARGNQFRIAAPYR